MKNTKIIKDFEIWMEVKYRAKNVGQIIRAIIVKHINLKSIWIRINRLFSQVVNSEFTE